MAHQLESMFSVVETPWHGLGKILDRPPTTKEAIVAAGLDWEVRKCPLYLARSAGPNWAREDREAVSLGKRVEAFATVRQSDDRILGHHVGPSYTVLQNAAAFEWFDPFVASGQATLETAGSLRDGAVVWALARIGREDSIIVPKSDDRVAKYLLLSNSHDGTLSVRVGFTPTRVVCANTLAMAHDAGASQLLRLKHTSSLAGALEIVRDTIDLANKRFEATAQQYRALASKQVNAKDLARFVSQVFDAPEVSAPNVDDLIPARFLGKSKESRKEKYARERQDTIEHLFLRGKGNDLAGTRGTWWALYNGVTEYLQYARPRSTAESRLDSLTFGSAAATSRKALGLALERVAA